MIEKTKSAAERDILAALKRLEDGLPTNELLIKRLEQGTLKINPLTVTLEAGRSRTLVGTEDCPLQFARRKILESKGISVRAGTLQAQVKDLKERLNDAREQIRIKDSAMAVMLSKIATLEDRLRENGIGFGEKIVPMRKRRPSQ